MCVALHSQNFGGDGEPLVILHGLFGSSNNWSVAGKSLAHAFHVRAPDLRNHGASPHAAGMDYPNLAADVAKFIDSLGVGPVHLLGHSMGGKVAMRLAIDAPSLVRSLTFVDIAPKDYAVGSRELDALRALDLSVLRSRREADVELAKHLGDRPTRQFLLTNLRRDPDGGFRWRLNLSGLAAGLSDIRAAPLQSTEVFDGRVLALIGEQSSFVEPADETLIRHHFPTAEVIVIDGSGHNPHVEAPEKFTYEVVRFALGDGTAADRRS